MTAQYRVLQKSFIAPHMLAAGSIIETDAVPGDHWEPLNAEAEAAMEEWYNWEVPGIDLDGKSTGKMVKPNMAKKPAPLGEALARPSVVLISDAPLDTTRIVGIAEASNLPFEDDLVARGKMLGDTRPADAPLVASGETSFDGGTKVIAAVEPPKPSSK